MATAPTFSRPPCHLQVVGVSPREEGRRCVRVRPSARRLRHSAKSGETTIALRVGQENTREGGGDGRGRTDGRTRSLADFSMQSFARSDSSRALRGFAIIEGKQTKQGCRDTTAFCQPALIDSRWNSVTPWYDQAPSDRKIPHPMPGISISKCP